MQRQPTAEDRVSAFDRARERRGAGIVVGLVIAAVAIVLLHRMTVPAALGSDRPASWSYPLLAAVVVASVLLMRLGYELGRWLGVLGFALAAVVESFIAAISAAGSGASYGLSVSVALALAGALTLMFSDSVDAFVAGRQAARIPPQAWSNGVDRSTRESSAPIMQALDPIRARRALRARRLAARLINIVTLLALLLGFAALGGSALGVLKMVQSVTELPRSDQMGTALHGCDGLRACLAAGLAGVLTSIAVAFAAVIVPVLALALLVQVYAWFFVGPFVFASPLVLATALAWRNPLRFLVLRPFDKRVLTAPLTRFLRREVSAAGHVYTLSDRTVRVPWYVRVPIVVGQIGVFSFRARRIWHPAHVARLRRAVRRTWLRNVNWCCSFTKLFSIACSDAGWRSTVQTLLDEVDVVLIDLSRLSENVVWELDECMALSDQNRVVFLTHSESEVQVRALLSSRGLSQDQIASRSVVYDRRSPEAVRRFGDYLVARVHRPASGPAWRFWDSDAPRRRVLIQVVLVLALLAVIVVLNLPPPKIVPTIVPTAPRAGAARALALAPSGEWGATIESDGAVRAFDVASGRLRFELLRAETEHAERLAVAGEEGPLVLCRPDAVVIWDFREARVTAKIAKEALAMPCRRLSVCSDAVAAQYMDRLLAFRLSTLQTTWSSSRSGVHAFSPDCSRLAVAPVGEALTIHDLAGTEQSRAPDLGLPIDAIGWVAGDGTLLLATPDGLFRWSIGERAPVAVEGATKQIRDLVAFRDGIYALWTTGRETYLARRGEVTHELAHPEEEHGPAWISELVVSEASGVVAAPTARGIAVWRLPPR